MIPRELFRTIRRVEVRTRGLVESVFGGAYHSAFRGRGIEFAEVRPYLPGDDVRTIDWNVSARTGEPYVKLFEEEREQTLLLVVDLSASGAFGSGARTKREVAAELCAILGFSALGQSDRVGLVLFTEAVERFVPPAKGRRHVLRVLRDVFAHAPRGRGTDLAGALDHVLRVVHQRAIVVVVSDFLIPAERTNDTARALRRLVRRHDAVALRLVDPREEALPAVGLLSVVDPETGRRAVVDTLSPRVRDAFAERAAERAARVGAMLRAARIDHVALRTDADVAEPLAAFFRRRGRRGAARTRTAA